MAQKIKIDISVASVLKIIAILFGIYLIYLVRDVILVLFIVAILTIALRPLIKSWAKVIGRPFSIVALILLILGIISGVIYLIIPPLVSQTIQLVQSIPEYIGRIAILRDHLPSLENGINSIVQNAGNLTSSIFSVTLNFFGGVVTFFTIIILTIYLIIDEKKFSSFAAQIIPDDKEHLFSNLLNKISDKVGSWLRGQILLGFIIGIISFLVLSIIGIPYALMLAVISGVLEIIPMLGPIIAGVIAALVALSISPVAAIIVVVFYIILQQVENNFIVPKVMQKAIGLPPAIIIIAILIGGKLLGIIGALLAVPVAGIIYVIASEWKSVKINRQR